MYDENLYIQQSMYAGEEGGGHIRFTLDQGGQKKFLGISRGFDCPPPPT